MSCNNTIIKIENEHNLLRRFIHPNPPNFTYLKDDGTICSTCFQLRSGEQGLSVDIEHLTTYEKSIIDRKKYRLLSINAGKVNQLELSTKHDPLPENYAHALIKGNIDKKKSRKLAYFSVVVPYP